MAFTNSFIETVKTNTNLIELVQEHVELQEMGTGVYGSRCPHPDHNDSDPSFRVFDNNKRYGKKKAGFNHSWCCMGCHNGPKNKQFKNYGSDCFAFIQWMSKGKISWQEAVIMLAKRANISIEHDKFTEIYWQNFILAKAYNRNLHESVRSYLNNRGFDDQTIQDWLIGWNGSTINFPLFDRYKNIIGFSNRRIGTKHTIPQKYKNSPTSDWFNKSQYLYGIHTLDYSFDEIRITEGCPDVILAYKHGVKNAVAPLGTSFTESHADLIMNLHLTPVWCTDADEAGLKSLERSIAMMAKRGIYAKVFIPPPGMDMADLSNALGQNTEQYITDNALLYWQYKLQHLIVAFESKINEAKIKILPQLKTILSSISNENELQIFKEYVKEKVGIRL